MGIKELPEVKLARKIFSKHKLTIPFDLDGLVSQYATLHYKAIPIQGVDGVSINLKTPGKNPTIIVNTLIPKTRQLFTLAHELGHIIIPWHLGTIVDDIFSQSYKDYLYSEIEHEANRFAAELLMPKDWVMDCYNKCKNDIASLQFKITNIIGVSDQAAAIRLIETLPQDIVYTAEFGEYVTHSGSTLKTTAFLQQEGDFFNKRYYRYVDAYSSHTGLSETYHWWKLASEIQIEITDPRSWREILNDIAVEINPVEGIDQFKKSINGIVAAANGKVKRDGSYNKNSLIATCIHRLNRPDLKSFTSHPDFTKFVKYRIDDFFK